MAEAIATQSWGSDNFSALVDPHIFSDTLSDIPLITGVPALIYLSHGTLIFLVHGRRIFATAPALIQITGAASVETTSQGNASGKYWTFKPAYNDALRDVEGLTVTPFETALEAARIGGRPIALARTRYGVLAIAYKSHTGKWECIERFHISSSAITTEARIGVLLWSTSAILGNAEDSVDIAIIGAGPTGLSAAAWAQELGLSYRIYGEPLAFWKRHIAPLPLRSPPASTNISSPRPGYQYVDYARQHAIDTETPVSMAAFLAYANWFCDAQGIEPQAAVVEHVCPDYRHWLLRHTDGTTKARNVVVSVGLQTMQRQPNGLDNISPHWSYVSDVLDYSHFSGKQIAVLGAGQSAIEAALLASQAGARVVLVIRRPAIQYRCLHTPGEWLYRNLFKKSKHFIAYLPSHLQDRLLRYLLKGTVETSLESVFNAADIPVLAHSRIDACCFNDTHPAVFTSDGKSFPVDHVLVAAGYDYDVRRIPFLTSVDISHHSGLPILDRYSMSSAAGLFFSGISTVRRFGPQAQFVFGTGVVSPRIMQGVQRRTRVA